MAKYNYLPLTGYDYLSLVNYYPARQDELYKLMCSKNEEDRKKFIEILGHDIDWSKHNYHYTEGFSSFITIEPIKEIAEKEGWRYNDMKECYADPWYRAVAKIERRPPDLPMSKYPEKVLLSGKMRVVWNELTGSEEFEKIISIAMSVGCIVWTILVPVLCECNPDITSSGRFLGTFFIIAGWWLCTWYLNKRDRIMEDEKLRKLKAAHDTMLRYEWVRNSTK